MRTDGQTQTDRQADMTKLIVAFRNFANLTKTIHYALLSSSQYSDWAMGWTNEFGLNSSQERDISVLSTEPRPLLGFTQFPIRCVPGALSPGMKRPRRDSDNTTQCSGKIKNKWCQTFTRYNSSCHGSELSIGTLLQLPLILQCSLGALFIHSLHSHFQSEFSTEFGPVFPLSNSSIFFFP
jgi:hypothetical protein